MSFVLEAKDLCFCYGNTELFSLDKLNCQIKKHHFTSIIGPNGSGKSTLFKCLSGIYIPHKGEVIFKGKNIQKVSKVERAKTLALIQQKNEVSARLTVREIVEFGRLPYKKKNFGFGFSKKDDLIIENVLNQVGIKDIENKIFQELSGGQQQRVWLALALVQEPEIILLDEPTNFLDILYQLEILDLLKQMVNQKKITVCAILHDLNQVKKYSDEVIVMKDGKIVVNGKTNEVLNSQIVYDVFRVNANEIKSHENTIFDFYLKGKNV